MHRAQGGERPASSGHRHRFVQDGEVPVVLVNNGNGNTSAPAPRPAEARSHNGRPAPTAAEFGAERAQRERAERALQQAQAMIRDLETKLAHAEMARTDAQNAARTAKEGLATLRAQSVNEVQRLNGLLAEERAARQKLEQRAARSQAAAAAAAASPPAAPRTVVTPTGEVRVKRAYTKRKRYPLADLSDITGGAAVEAAAKVYSEAGIDIAAAVEPAVAPAPAPAPAPKPVTKRAAAPAAKAARPVRPAKEPKPVKWWVKSRTP